ncbi:MAG TPA: alpha/beta fold hydrolase [Polyangiaceae bacterium]|nr:alpha/beta fold hydrolase [Polyangiaceae bacterium]
MPRLDLGQAALSAALAAIGYTSRRVQARTGLVNVVEHRGGGPLPTIVLLHGLGSRGADYLPLLQRLRRHARRVVAPDLPGHGASYAPAHFDLDSCVDALGEALDVTLDEPAVVFGNSLGGLTAIRLALTRPHRVRGLFLASPAGAPSSPAELDALVAALRIETHGDALRFLATVLHDEPGAMRHVVAWSLRRRYHSRALRALMRDVPRAQPLDPAELARLTMPVYLLWGRDERLLPPSHLVFFRAHLRGATIEEPRGLGHSPQLDDVEGVARRLLAFARDV